MVKYVLDPWYGIIDYVLCCSKIPARLISFLIGVHFMFREEKIPQFVN
jgi:hypothetical protein